MFNRAQFGSFLVVVCLFQFTIIRSQTYFYKGNVVDWTQLPQLKASALKVDNKNSSAIIDDHLDIRFGNLSSEITRLLSYYVASESDVTQLSSFALPDNFDNAYSDFMQTQGRKDLNKGASLDAFLLKSFAARQYRNGVWQALEIDYKFVKRRWMNAKGEIRTDEVPVMRIKGLKPDSYLQIYYSAKFEGMYGNNIFYLNSSLPKQAIDYYFEYKVPKSLASSRFAGVFNLPDSCIDEKSEFGKDEVTMRLKLKCGDLKAINYPQNVREADVLPHVVFDFFTIKAITQLYHDNGAALYDYVLTRPKNFEWLIIADTSVGYDKFYIKHFADLRKFLRGMPTLKADSGAVGFLKVYRDTLVNYRYISNNQIVYNEGHLLDVGIFDHLAKRRLPEEHEHLLPELLWEKGRFYYQGNVMDKRLGIHSTNYRAHFVYEHTLTVVPEGNLYHLYLGRPNGLNYYPNELPFYFEGAVAKLSPKNFSVTDTAKSSKLSKFIRLHEGTANENTRVENASAEIDLLTKEIDLKGKLNLSGQFSTILRHVYLGEAIDSSVATYYFKKCVDKPLASQKQIKTAVKLADYPFRHSFNYSEKIAVPNKNELNLSNWFSFVSDSRAFPQTPTHDFYFDFTYSDVYNFVLKFKQGVEITNAEAFKHSISNEIFELQSELLKQEDGSYLAKVNMQIKTPLIKQNNMAKLQEFTAALDAINKFTCSIKML